MSIQSRGREDDTLFDERIKRVMINLLGGGSSEATTDNEQDAAGTTGGYSSRELFLCLNEFRAKKEKTIDGVSLSSLRLLLVAHFIAKLIRQK